MITLGPAMAVMEPGTVFASYRIERLLGSGGFCNVYLAEDARPALKRKVALKVLSAALSSDDKNRERFRRESLLAVELDDHPNIVDVHDAGEHDGQLFIAQRFIDGHDLADELEDNGPLAPARAVEVLSEIGGALDYAHGAGLIHRDVKPRNILIRARDGQCFLGDFGLTKRTTSGNSLTGAGEFLGTFAYAAPEQLGGEQVDGRADLYALGCCLYESLTGSPPFFGDMHTMITSHLTKPAPRASETVVGVPAGLDDVIAKAMAKEPDDRYQSGKAMADAAAAALTAAEPRHSTITLPKVTPVPVPPTPGSGFPPPPPPAPEPKPEPAPQPVVVAHPVLEIRPPGRKPLYLQVRTELEVGRDCDGLLLDDDELSRRHALLTADADGVSIADLGSTNGTFVDGQRVDGHRRLTAASVVRIGTTEIRVVTDEEPGGGRSTRPSAAARGTIIHRD
jgi:serine/threonine-protein kinase